MGRRGPPKKPTALKLIEGCPGGKSRINENEPQPEPPESLDPPAGLDEVARQVWNEETPSLAALGILTGIDLGAFERYCDLRSKWKQAKDFLDRNGFYYAIYHEQTAEEIAVKAKPRLKYMAQFPQVSIYLQTSKELTRLEQNFGMTPSARANLDVKPPVADDPMEAFLRRESQ